MNSPPSVVGDDVARALVACMKTTPRGGSVVEVGVYKGGTLWHLVAHAEGRPVYGYDTFSGIPYAGEWDQHRVGDFGDTSVAAVKAAVPQAIVVQGVFPRSAVRMPPVSFVHIDCDQYQSITDTVRYLRPMMLRGGVMWFDDYCLPSGKKAVDELFGDRAQPAGFGKVMARF